MKGFPDEVKRAVSEAQNYKCKGCLNPINSIHHKVRDTEFNRRRYPLFINSPMNAVGLCSGCHTSMSHKYRITDNEAEMYEEWLVKLIRRKI